MNDIRYLLANVIPIALAGAISPVLLAASLLLLGTKDRPKLKITAFALGSFLVIFLFGLLGLFVFNKTLTPSDSKPKIASILIDMVIGFGLIFLGIKKAKQPAQKKHFSEGQFKSSKSIYYFIYLGIFFMIINFSTLVLYLGAIKQIGEAKIALADKIFTLLFVDIIIMIPILVPLLAYLLVPRYSQNVLLKANAYFTSHGNKITAALLLLFGAYLIIKSAKILTEIFI